METIHPAVQLFILSMLVNLGLLALGLRTERKLSVALHMLTTANMALSAIAEGKAKVTDLGDSVKIEWIGGNDVDTDD